MSNIDDASYYGDVRVRDAGKNSIPILYGCERCYEPEGCCDCTDEQFGSGETKLPWKWAVCPTCDGRGKHVNPSIDSNGLTSEDFAEDLEFAQDYMEGVYDVSCSRCNGRTTIPIVDCDAMSPELRKAHEEDLRTDADYYAECMAEIRMGA